MTQAAQALVTDKKPTADLPKSSSHKLTIAAPTLHSQYLQNLAHIDLELLPPLARDLVRLIGEADAVALMRHAGGTLVYIPDKANETHALAHLLSGKGWQKLCRVYATQRIQIPKCTHALMHLRNARMVADADLMYKQEGSINYNELCIKYGLTHRNCEKIVNAAQHQGISAFLKTPESRTLDLF